MGSTTPYRCTWQGTIKRMGKESCKEIEGPYRLCLSNQEISIVKLGETSPSYIFQFSTIRSFRQSDNFFVMELGRNAVTGSGELWMQMDKTRTAQTMYRTVLVEMGTPRNTPEFRGRSNTGPSAKCTPEEIYNIRRRAASLSIHKQGHLPSPSTSPSNHGNRELGLNSTPVSSKNNNLKRTSMTPPAPPIHSGYIDMTPGKKTPKNPTPIDMATPITRRPTNNETGYLEMGPATVSPVPCEDLKPDKVQCYLSDDSISAETPKRANSVGNRPTSKPEFRTPLPVDGARRSCSSKHQRSHSQQIDAMHRKAQQDSYTSSINQSMESEDCLMEMDFRPRSVSDIKGYRPRLLNFNLKGQGHRPRSSSNGKKDNSSNSNNDNLTKVGQQSKIEVSGSGTGQGNKVKSEGQIDSQTVIHTQTSGSSRDKTGKSSSYEKCSSNENDKTNSRGNESTVESRKIEIKTTKLVSVEGLSMQDEGYCHLAFDK